jgi:hypothetical protein
LRAAHPTLYAAEADKAAAGQPALVTPVPADLDQDLLCLQLAEVLHVPAHHVPYLPLRWVNVAMTLLEAHELIREHAADDAADEANW